jgi:hypothetical protein
MEVLTMFRTVMGVLLDNRKNNAASVQKILTDWGCFIKVRLGLHDGVLNTCSESGLLVLELVGDTEKHEELKKELNSLKGVKAEIMRLDLE